MGPQPRRPLDPLTRPCGDDPVPRPVHLPGGWERMDLWGPESDVTLVERLRQRLSEQQVGDADVECWAGRPPAGSPPTIGGERHASRPSPPRRRRWHRWWVRRVEARRDQAGRRVTRRCTGCTGCAGEWSGARSGRSSASGGSIRQHAGTAPSGDGGLMERHRVARVLRIIPPEGRFEPALRASDPPTSGWWLDPTDPHYKRYHDGTRWTDRRIWIRPRHRTQSAPSVHHPAESDVPEHQGLFPLGAGKEGIP